MRERHDPQPLPRAGYFYHSGHEIVFNIIFSSSGSFVATTCIRAFCLFKRLPFTLYSHPPSSRRWWSIMISPAFNMDAKVFRPRRAFPRRGAAGNIRFQKWSGRSPTLQNSQIRRTAQLEGRPPRRPGSFGSRPAENHFSTPWKKTTRFFHTMENFFAIFPHNGKNVSTLWKTFCNPFTPA